MTKYYYNNKNHTWRYKYSPVIMCLIVMLFLIASFLFFWPKKTKSPTVTKANSASETAAVDAQQAVTGRYLFNGTVVIARAVERAALKPGGGYDYAQPFSQLSTMHRENYDAWSTDFECPITNNVVPYATQISNLVFNCRPEFLPELTKYFDIYDLANNHTGDQGVVKGIVETHQHLAATGKAQYFGNYEPGVLKDICEVINLPVHVQKADKTQADATLPVAFCGWHYFMRKPLPGEIEMMQRYAKIMPTFAFVEMGVEYLPKATQTQVDIAHAIADQGPEFVIANNPHWVQNTEVYKGKLIVYSLGNFIFDQIDTETQRGASIDMTMTVPYDQNLSEWLNLSPQCASFQDTCLERAEQKGLKKPHVQLKYAVVASQGGAGKLTHLADAATQKAVEERMNWAQTLQQLGQ